MSNTDKISLLLMGLGVFLFTYQLSSNIKLSTTNQPLIAIQETQQWY